MNNTITPMTTTMLDFSKTEKSNTTSRTGLLHQIHIDKMDKIGNTNPDEKPMKMLLSLIRSTISGEELDKEAFKGANYHDWSKLLEKGTEASVTGIAYDSIAKLPKGTVPTGILVKMQEYIREIEDKYARQEKTIGQITEELGKENIEVIQLKGLGLSTDYPVPQHRHGRDIDIYTRYKGTVTEGRSNSTDFVDQYMLKKGLVVEDYDVPKTKHSEFFYNNLTVENHKFFVNKEAMPEAKLVDELLHKKLNPEIKILPNGTKILVPSKEFNTIFLAQHAFQHYAFSGIDLHNLLDWSMHIKQNGFEVPKELKGTKLETFMNALTNVSHKYMGTKPTAPENPEYEKDLISRILKPQADPIPQNMTNTETFIYKTKRFWNHYNRSKELTGNSFTKTIWHSVKAHLRKPETILMK